MVISKLDIRPMSHPYDVVIGLEMRGTITANLAGIPGVSVPCGFTKSNLPIGLQLLAPAFAEENLLRPARVFERETDWHLKRPGLS
jgi:aspartyl-tRNA(Asn)/glutamyl-tRNA(Gln) amidotransferase subunit A